MKKYIFAISLILCYNVASADQKVVFVDVPDSDFKVKCIKETVNNALSCNWDEWNEREAHQKKMTSLLRQLEFQAEMYEIREKAQGIFLDDMLGIMNKTGENNGN